MIRKRFGTVKRSGDEIQVCCPFCPTVDKKFKLYINVSKSVFNCFRCESHGVLSSLFPQLAAVTVEQKEEDSNSEALEQLPRGVMLHTLTYPWSDLVFGLLLDKGFSPASLDNITYFCENYIKKAINKDKQDYQYGPCLVFPIIQFGSYRGFQARTIYKNREPKYIGATNMDKSKILYNYDVAFSQKERLIVTEGFFDCLKSGNEAIATLGKKISDKQLRLIKLNDFREVIVFLDKDAEKESRWTARQIAMFFPTYLAIPTKKDPGLMTRLEINDLLSNKRALERVY
jgi:hypothetical protein